MNLMNECIVDVNFLDERTCDECFEWTRCAMVLLVSPRWCQANQAREFWASELGLIRKLLYRVDRIERLVSQKK